MATKKKTEVVNEDGQTPAGATLQTKSAMMSGILAAMGAMSHDQMMQWFPDAMALAQTIPGGAAAQNQASVQTGIREDAERLFSGDELNEEAKDRVLTLIENAVDVRVSVEKARLEEEFENRLVEETAAVQEAVIEKVDQYITYAAEQWVEKNEVAIQAAVRVETAEKLIQGLTQLLGECNIEVSDEKVDMVGQLEEKIAELEGKLNEQVEENIQTERELTAVRAMSVFKDVSEGLTLVDVEKFRKLVEDIDVTGDPEELKKKITIVRDAHFKGDKKPASTQVAEGLTEEQVAPAGAEQIVEEKAADPQMNRYAEAISRASNNRYRTFKR
jgi:hypothetical protein